MATQNNTPLEYDECLTFVEFLQLKKIRFAHVHNEMYTRSWNQKRRAKALGVSSGVPDYMIFISKEQSNKDRALLLFVEMKRKKGSTTSKAQKEWLSALNEVPWVQGKVCKGADKAIEFVKRFIGYTRT